ncbi:MAG: sulfotransferase domain-containing protein [Pseudomonadota bacterium]
MTLQRIIWLASYPKSGNTWMRYLLAHYFMPKSEAPDINNIRKFTTSDAREDFFNKAAGKPFRPKSFEEWLSMRTKAIELIAASRPGTHFVKTHSQIQRIGTIDLIPPQVTAAAVYLMRNPFDIAPSFARHLGVDLDIAIDKMCDPKGINAAPTGLVEILGRWDDHIATWLDAPGLPRHVVRYEDMQADAEGTVRKLLGFLQVPVNDGQLRRALRESSFANMRKQEAIKGFRERPHTMKRFFHGGKSGTWREALSPAQTARLRESFLPALERYYPEILAETLDFAQGQ